MASLSIPDSLQGRGAPEQWVALPRELLQRLPAFRSQAELKVVLYVLSHTYGFREYATMKAITLDEFEHGRKRADGTRMDEGTGLSRAAIKLGLKQAKEDGFLYEAVDDHDKARIVRWYAVHLPSDGSTRGIDASPLAQPYDPQAPANSSASGIDATPLAQPYRTEMGTNGSVSGLDASPQRDRFQPPEGQKVAPGGIDASPRTEKETLERNQKKDTSEKAPGFDKTADADEDEALAQRYADQQVLQSLMAEHQSLQTLQPGQSGWGAAQRRLRAIAPEITRLQAQAQRQAEVMSDAERAPTALDAEVTEEGRSPAAQQSTRRVGGPPTSEPAASEQIARRQRLMQLQGELAQLKKTPSMQLLARQRIPRLEEAIKRLIAELQASA